MKAAQARCGIGALSILMLAGAGCATRSGTVDQRMLLPEGQSSYAMETRQVFRMPEALGNRTPNIPDDSARRELAPVAICASLVLSDSGAVERVALFGSAPQCAAGTGSEYADLQQVVLEGARGWRFDPAAICTYPDAVLAEAANGRCIDGEAEIKPVAVSLIYAFTFEIRHGKRRVSTRLAK